MFKNVIRFLLLFITSSFTYAQISVSGTVSDAVGPLPGAGVVVKGTTTGAIVDFDGNYNIIVLDSTSILVFTFIGFHRVEISVDDQTVINVILEVNDQSLDQTVVAPYITKDKSSKNYSIDADDYKVKLGVDENIKMYKTGQLTVWVGAAKEDHVLPPGMIIDSTYIPANIGQYAKITPYAPDFDVTPSETKCIKIDPSGSEVFFSLKPKKIGRFKVSARIELYSDLDCSGTPIPKTASTLSVIVETDRINGFKEKLNKMLSIFWDKFLSFWGALLALIFALLLFLLRRKLKRWTGFNHRPENE